MIDVFQYAKLTTEYCTDEPQHGFFVAKLSGDLKETKLCSGVSRVMHLGTFEHASPHTGEVQPFVKLQVLAGANAEKIVFFPKMFWDAQVRQARWYQPNIH